MNTTKTTKTNTLRKEETTMKFNIVSKHIVIENENHIVYGIQRGTIKYDNLSSIKEEVESFIRVLNDNNVSDYHIEDMIEDFLFNPQQYLNMSV